jgi:5-methylcytosine-specific restriction enzyme subunit McrC
MSEKVFYLKEFEVCEKPIPLTIEDINLLQDFHSNHIEVLQKGERYQIKAKSYVGKIFLPSGIEIIIQTKVPINNLLYIISYTYDLASFKEPESRELSKEQSILEMYILVLVNWCEYLFRKGLYSNYELFQESTNFIKGKLSMVQTIKNNRKPICEFDELTISTLKNQIIKATLILCVNKVKAPSELHKKVLILLKQMGRIQRIELSNKHFKSVFYNQLNHHYKQIIDLCQLIFWSNSLKDDTGKHIFSSFLVDMNKVFESFIYKLLKQRLSEYKVLEQSQKSNWAVSENLSDNFLPILKPDILIGDSLVIDTKYYPSPLSKNIKFYNNHLYQILSYMGGFKIKSGMLIYPQNGEKNFINSTYQTEESKKFTIYTLNLYGTIKDLNCSIDSLIEAIKNRITLQPISQTNTSK